MSKLLINCFGLMSHRLIGFCFLSSLWFLLTQYGSKEYYSEPRDFRQSIHYILSVKKVKIKMKTLNKLTAKLENSFLGKRLKKLFASRVRLHRQLSIRYIERNKNKKVKPEEEEAFEKSSSFRCSTKNISNCPEVDPKEFTDDKDFSRAESNSSFSPSIDSCFSEKYTFSFTEEDILKYQTSETSIPDVPVPVPVDSEKLTTISSDNGYESELEFQSVTQSLERKKHLRKCNLSKSAIEISTNPEILSDYDIAHRLGQWDYLLYIGKINIEEYHKKNWVQK